MEDREADAASGAWNPLTATGTPLSEARRLCDDALHGVRLALREVEFADGKLVHVLLAHELRRSVDRAFGTSSCSHQEGHEHRGGQGLLLPEGSFGPPPGNPYGPQPGHPYGPPPGGPAAPPPPRPPRDRRGLIAGCLVWAGLACTCQMCCGSFEDPWSRERREAPCQSCGDCCEACSCCGDCGEGCCCCGESCGCDC
ncbi:hypothetical protein GCM10010342_37060 [Streptomyces anulatus]|nr:hypothetical protein GCM10010342_37060 [Streptomyces anulatus]